MTAPAPTPSWQRLARGAVGVVVLGLGWEAFARSRLFAPALTHENAAHRYQFGRAGTGCRAR